jgi:hypothetical protein
VGARGHEGAGGWSRLGAVDNLRDRNPWLEISGPARAATGSPAR